MVHATGVPCSTRHHHTTCSALPHVTPCLLPLQASSVWYLQVFEVFTHLIAAYDDVTVEHGHNLVKTASTELLVHAQLLPLAELEKLSLSTIRSDMQLWHGNYVCLVLLSVGWIGSCPK